MYHTRTRASLSISKARRLPTLKHKRYQMPYSAAVYKLVRLIGCESVVEDERLGLDEAGEVHLHKHQI